MAKRYNENEVEPKKPSPMIPLTVRVPRELHTRISRFIAREQEGRPHLRNWFINKWISDGLKREGEGY